MNIKSSICTRLQKREPVCENPDQQIRAYSRILNTVKTVSGPVIITEHEC